ncbi:hypothetical protein EHEL_111120 [Encephalitozoon hellem ATCC 50504]|uniref:Transcription initiation factor IIF subunit alpha n=1 Tax=Encephalitozoon hellem TaxID=27973 RepID=A0A9Q9F950_ENCHE|nr:uncharacterized protein EHEL_111120 [Encephalitozoon hellem ATCC 50504]AFM99386.1 hypothetical protein EHEL_111120 [Encephalitozoon hellem ATCC 50504]UTX44394.1 hypothetical protein GPU96_11g21960 [Encephalitozoon hellem]WEL39895.1 hypothetical protein PFJ87_11g01320 [Encephalitozoon hellem]|eukprot:XP_003888367.1 hypothetical protein EHEL_111120 [Encephalitozoon hellem ATCC 50504]
MKSYKLVYKPEQGEKRFLFTNVDVKELSGPVTISRERPLKEEVVFNTKKKSEQVEYEDEEYKKLKEKEGCLLVLEDAESRAYSGKMQDLGASGSCYFVFINTGTYLKVVPIRKWYRFSQKSQLDIIQEYDMEGVGEENGGGEEDKVSSEEKEEIDFDEDFDDDDGEETNVFVIREKRLNSAGRRMRNIMENYEEKEKSDVSEEMEEREVKEERVDRALTKDVLRGMFRGGRIALRDLLRGVKTRFGLNDEEKELVKEFIGENCTFDTDEGNKEKYLVLKK